MSCVDAGRVNQLECVGERTATWRRQGNGGGECFLLSFLQAGGVFHPACVTWQRRNLYAPQPRSALYALGGVIRRELSRKENRFQLSRSGSRSSAASHRRRRCIGVLFFDSPGPVVERSRDACVRGEPRVGPRMRSRVERR